MNQVKKIPVNVLLIVGGPILLCLALCLGGLIAISSRLNTLVPTLTPKPLLETRTPLPTRTITPIPPTAVPPTSTPTLQPTDTPEPLFARIPGVTPEKLQAKLRQLNLSCAAVNSSELDGVVYYSWSCSRNEYNLQYFVTITSRSLDNVDAISASILQTNQPSKTLTANFLEFAAALPFLDHPVLQFNARTWVERSLPSLTGVPGDILTTSINFVDYQLYGPPGARTLFMGNLK